VVNIGNRVPVGIEDGLTDELIVDRMTRAKDVADDCPLAAASVLHPGLLDRKHHLLRDGG
jgi:hypothetical protein